MTSSLVGSEMCIRDSIHIAREAKAEHDRVVDAATRLLQRCWRGHLGRIPVSYTHLTLPTICSV
eukprot:3370704-Prorocentrum_lima.AAC.1